MPENSSPPAAPQPRSTESTAKIVYVLYLLSFVVPVTPLIGVVMAYVYEGEAPDWLKTHYRYQIRTFWIGLLYAVVAAILTLLLVGWLLAVFAAVWLVVRCVKGLMWMERSQPVASVGSWLW